MQKTKTFMSQSFQETEAIEVQYTEQCTVHYTVDDLVALLNVKRRQIFNLVKIVKQAYFWEPEAVFNPSLGKYSEKCLIELKRLQACKNSNEYTALVASENQKPNTRRANTSSALTIPTRQTEVIESKLAKIQSNLATQNLSIQERMTQALVKISEEKTRSNTNQSTLDDVRKQQIALKATEDALAEHAIYQQVKNAVAESLQLQDLKGE